MIDFIIKNWAYICTGLFGLIVVCSVICKLTPSTKDDGFIAKLIGVLDHFSVVQTPRNKKLLEVAKEISEEKEG